MADQKTTDAAVTSLLKRYYDQVFIETLEPKTYLHQFGIKKPMPKGKGKIIEFTGYKTISPILQNSNEYSSTQIYISAYTITATLIQRHAYLQFTTLLKQTSIDPDVEGAVKEMGSMMARTVECYLRGVVVGKVGTAARSSANNLEINYLAANNDMNGVITGSSAQRTHYFWSPFPCLINKARLSSSGASICTMSGSAATISQVRYGVTFLRDRNVPGFEGDDYVLYCNPMVADRLMADPAWKTWNNSQNSKETMWKGEVGRVFGARVVQSTCAFRYVYSAAPLTTASGAFNASILLGKGAYGVSELTGANKDKRGFSIYIKSPGPNSTNDPNELLHTLGGKMVMTAAVLNKSAACVLLSTDRVVSSAS